MCGVADANKKRPLDNDSETTAKKPRSDSAAQSTTAAGVTAAPASASASAANSLAPVNSQAAEGLQKAREASKTRWELNLWDPVYRRDTRPLVPVFL